MQESDYVWFCGVTGTSGHIDLKEKMHFMSDQVAALAQEVKQLKTDIKTVIQEEARKAYQEHADSNGHISFYLGGRISY